MASNTGKFTSHLKDLKFLKFKSIFKTLCSDLAFGQTFVTPKIKHMKVGGIKENC